MSLRFETIFDRARVENRLAIGMYLIPGFPSWEDSQYAVERAVGSGVDFIEFPAIGTGRFTPRTGSTIAKILGGALDDGRSNGRLARWLAAVNTGVGVVYDGAWPEPDLWQADPILLQRSDAFLMEADVYDIAAWAKASDANWQKPVVTTVDACRESLSATESARLKNAAAFIYMSLGRQTGELGCDTPAMRRKVTEIRAAGCGTPVCAAFGIRTASDVLTVRRAGCDGVIIGSAALEALEQGTAFFGKWLDLVLGACTSGAESAGRGAPAIVI